ncbi:MAG: HDOD domain-containing protein [Gammaproteobacteria bacterium]|nr:HDOD domain-containing protein [Gammaproteobacteria bacterium]
MRGIAAAACMDRSLLSGGDGSPILADALIRHSIATGAAAEALAKASEKSLAPEAFIAGLLHDFGVVVQMRLNTAGMRRYITSGAGISARENRALELDSLSVSHEHCSGLIPGEWRLPEILCEAVRHRHGSRAAVPAAQKLAALVEIGQELSLSCRFGYGAEMTSGGLPGEALSLLRIRDEVIADCLAGLQGRVRELESALTG